MEVVVKVSWDRLDEIHKNYGVSFETIIHAAMLSEGLSDMVREKPVIKPSKEDSQPLSYPAVEPKNLYVMVKDDVCT